MDSRGVVLVAGAGGGLGGAIARAAATDGCSTALGARERNQRVMQVYGDISAHARAAVVRGDVLDRASVQTMVDDTRSALGPIDALVCATGLPVPPGRWLQTPWESFETQWNLHVRGTWNLLDAVLPEMVKQKRGIVVLVCSSYARARPPPNLAPYVTVKFALRGLAHALAAELTPKGIVVHLVVPSLTETGMTKELPGFIREAAAGRSPSGALATPADTGLAVAALLRLDQPIFSGNELLVGSD